MLLHVIWCLYDLYPGVIVTFSCKHCIYWEVKFLYQKANKHFIGKTKQQMLALFCYVLLFHNIFMYHSIPKLMCCFRPFLPTRGELDCRRVSTWPLPMSCLPPALWTCWLMSRIAVFLLYVSRGLKKESLMALHYKWIISKSNSVNLLTSLAHLAGTYV